MNTIQPPLPDSPAKAPGNLPTELTPGVIPEASADVPSVDRLTEIQASLKKLERRDWWLWVMAVIVMLLLTGAVVSMSFPELLKTDDALFRFSLNQAVRGLVGLVLLFNTYTIYQQVQVKRLRRQLSEQLEAMGRLRVRAEEFHRLATIDPLTGLYNRRFAEQRLAAEASRSQRYGHPLTVISFDLNNFKKINDKHGHPVGDEVLKAFADRLNTAIRVSDWAVRMGGDEFLAILPECAIAQVQSLINRIAKVEVEHDGARIPVAFSYGCVGYEPGETPERFLERADELLYADKRRSKKAAPQLSYAHQ